MTEISSISNISEPEKKRRHVIEEGIPKFACIESYEERADISKHVFIDEQTYNALSRYAHSLSTEEKRYPVGTAASDLIGEAIDAGWRPYKSRKDSVKSTFVKCSKNVSLKFTKSDSEKLKSLAEASGITVSDFIKIALCWKLVMNKEYTEKPW